MDERDEPLDAIYDRVRADLDRERGPLGWLRARPTPLRAALVAAAALLSVAALVALSGRLAGFGARPVRQAAAVGGLALAFGLALRAALRPMHRPQWRGGARALLLGGLLAFALGSIVVASDGTVGGGLGGRCLVVGLVAGAPALLLTLLVLRDPGRGALFAGLAGGLTGSLAVQLVCVGRQPLTHAVIEHFGVVVVTTAALGGLGALLARRPA